MQFCPLNIRLTISYITSPAHSHYGVLYIKPIRTCRAIFRTKNQNFGLEIPRAVVITSNAKFPTWFYKSRHIFINSLVYYTVKWPIKTTVIFMGKKPTSRFWLFNLQHFVFYFMNVYLIQPEILFFKKESRKLQLSPNLDGF